MDSKNPSSKQVKEEYLLLESFPTNSFICLRYCVWGGGEGGESRNYLFKQQAANSQKQYYKYD